MSIQQSINHMLATSTIAAGLYSRSPAGQTAAELKKKRARLKTIESSISEGIASSPTAETEAAEIASEIFNLSPSQKNLDVEAEWMGTRDKRIAELAQSQSRLEMRKKLLQGVPEVPVKRTKVEVINNGEE